MPHHWYAIVNAQADAACERTNATHQVNAMQSNVIQILVHFRQLVKHCDDTTFNWKNGTKARRYWKKILNQCIDQVAGKVTVPR